MKKFGSIEQFRNVVKSVRLQHDYKGKDNLLNPLYLNTTPYPTLKFEGTVKLHGTNGGIVLYKDGSIKYQSRERELSLGSDNMGFMTYMSGVDLYPLFEGIQFEDYIAIYGEWCGRGIQKGVGISELDRMFVIFSCRVDGELIDLSGRDIKESRIYNISNFKKFEIDIDFNEPEMSQNKLIEWTLDVERECPVAKKFGVSGIGEGIVFRCVERPELVFKSKGEKHSSSKVKKLNSVDTELLESMKEFVEYACTENRLKQGLEHVESIDIKNTGDFVRWVCNDILKEESDTLVKNNIEWKKVAPMISKKASSYFRNL